MKKSPVIPDWVIQRQVPDYPQFLVESKKLGLRDPFCLIRDPFTFRRYPGFLKPRHHPQWHLTAIWKGEKWDEDKEFDADDQQDWLEDLSWAELQRRKIKGIEGITSHTRRFPATDGPTMSYEPVILQDLRLAHLPKKRRS